MKKILASAIGFGLPVLAFAQTLSNADSVIAMFYRYSNIAIAVLISIAVLVIVYGVVMTFILGADDSEKRKAGREKIIYGIIGLAVILSIWGLVGLVTNTFRVSGGNNAPTGEFPQIPQPRF